MKNIQEVQLKVSDSCPFKVPSQKVDFLRVCFVSDYVLYTIRKIIELLIDSCNFCVTMFHGN